jgi:hypothetical protein
MERLPLIKYRGRGGGEGLVFIAQAGRYLYKKRRCEHCLEQMLLSSIASAN